MKKTINTLKWQSIVAVLLFNVFAVTFTSCNRDDGATTEPAKNYDIKGYYKGTYGSGTAETGFNLCFVIEESGKLTYVLNYTKLNSAPKANVIYGTYTTNANSFAATVTSPGETVTFSATFEPTTGKLSGSWSSSSGVSGKFTTQKDISGKDSITGYWKGTYNPNGSSTNYPYVMIGESDGTLTVVDYGTVTNAASNAYGNFTLNNNDFSTTIKFDYGTNANPYIFSATFDKTAGKLINGTWSGNGSTGTWTVTKMYY